MKNKILLIGRIERGFESEIIDGITYYTSDVSVLRTSGTRDYISIRTTNHGGCGVNDRVIIDGVIRSKDCDGGHTEIYVYSDKVLQTSEKDDLNEVVLIGNICIKKNLRRTPLGRTIYDCILAVHTTPNITDFIPIIFWGARAIDEFGKDVGSEVIVNGRLQSRTYLKNNVTKTVYEVSANPL